MGKAAQTSHRPLYSESQHVKMRLEAYYRVLNAQPEFLAALEQLRCELLPWLLHDDEDPFEWHRRLQLDDDETVEQRGERLRKFGERWGLPRWRGESSERRYRLPNQPALAMSG